MKNIKRGTEMLWQDGGLPTAFQRCEYIESHGNEWINLGIKGNSENSYQLTYQMTSEMNAAIFGSRNKSLYYAGPILSYTLTGIPSNSVAVFCGNGVSIADDDTNNLGAWGGKNDLFKHTILFAPTEGVALLDNNSPTYHPTTSDAFITDYDLYLFCNNVAGTRSASQKMKFYQLTIKSHSRALMNDFISCYLKTDWNGIPAGTIGVYDLCGSLYSNGTPFYTNAGDGAFTKGPDVV